jgi:hypothetical protein
MANHSTLERVAPAQQAPTEAFEAPPLSGVVEALALLDSFNRRRVISPQAAPRGRYLELVEDGTSWLLPLEREVTHIGRGLSVHVRFDDQRVSRRHAIVACRGGRVRVLDDRSANGTFVNGRRIGDADLTDGDVVLVGPVMLRYVEVPG